MTDPCRAPSSKAEALTNHESRGCSVFYLASRSSSHSRPPSLFPTGSCHFLANLNAAPLPLSPPPLWYYAECTTAAGEFAGIEPGHFFFPPFFWNLFGSRRIFPGRVRPPNGQEVPRPQSTRHHRRDPFSLRTPSPTTCLPLNYVPCRSLRRRPRAAPIQPPTRRPRRRRRCCDRRPAAPAPVRIRRPAPTLTATPGRPRTTTTTARPNRRSRPGGPWLSVSAFLCSFSYKVGTHGFSIRSPSSSRLLFFLGGGRD